jgi:hypothetical protein
MIALRNWIADPSGPHWTLSKTLIIDGLQHGFFQYSIACEVGNGGKRHLIISAGKSHKFTLRPDELPD